MSSTTIVKAPVIPQGSNINVTAPSTTNIPAWYYDGTRTVTASGGGIAPSPSNPLWFMRDTQIGSWLSNSTTWYATATFNYLWNVISFFWQIAWWNFYLDVIRLDWTTKVVSLVTYTWGSGGWNFQWDLYLDWTIVHMNYNSSGTFGTTPRHTNYDLTTNAFTWWGNTFNTTWILLTPSTVISWFTHTWWLWKPSTGFAAYIWFRLT